MQRGVPDALYGGLCMRQIPHNALYLPHEAPKLPCAVRNLQENSELR